MKRLPLRLSVDFLAPPAQTRTRNLLGFFATVLLLAATGGLYMQLAYQALALETRNQALRAELLQPLDTNVRPVTFDAASLKLMQQFSTPWDRLFDGLEAATTSQVALLSMQPNVRQGEVSLQGEAARYADILAYIEALKSQRDFPQAYLINHEVAEDVPGHPVRFTVLLKWRVES